MKYIYYILGILLLITLGILFQLTHLKIEISEPVLVINDKVISKNEVESLSRFGSYHSHGKGFLDSIVVRELLIQTAIKEGINKEEDFRQSVENFYEQSLVKILIDRKIKTISSMISEKQIARYQQYTGKTIQYTQFVYRNQADLKTGKPKLSTNQTIAFENLSDNLKYTFIGLEPGQSAAPEPDEEGIVVFQLNKIMPGDTAPLTDLGQIKTFLAEQSRRVKFENWLKQLKATSNIRILEPEIFDQGE